MSVVSLLLLDDWCHSLQDIIEHLRGQSGEVSEGSRVFQSELCVQEASVMTILLSSFFSEPWPGPAAPDKWSSPSCW